MKIEKIRTTRNGKSHYVSVYASLGGDEKNKNKRCYYVDYDVVDEKKKEFVSSKLLKKFRDSKDANEYAMKQAKKRNAQCLLHSATKSICIRKAKED